VFHLSPFFYRYTVEGEEHNICTSLVKLAQENALIGLKTNMTSITGNLQTVIDAACVIDRNHDRGLSR
jgi:hypothetical protein